VAFNLFSLADEAPVQNLPNATETRAELDNTSTTPGLWREHPGVVRAERVEGELLKALTDVTRVARRLLGADAADARFCPGGEWNADEARRYVNEILTGVASLKPEVTKEQAQHAFGILRVQEARS
jgi:hypothetical protein